MGEIQKVMKARPIDQQGTSASQPQADGVAERCVQTVKTAMCKCIVVRGGLGHRYNDLPCIQLGYKSAPQRASGCLPMQLLLSHKHVSPRSTTHTLGDPLLWSVQAGPPPPRRGGGDALGGAFGFYQTRASAVGRDQRQHCHAQNHAALRGAPQRRLYL